MNNKKAAIGIIAGAGPEAGADLWMKVLKHNRDIFGEDFSGDLDAPEVYVHSLPTLGYAMRIADYEEEIWCALKQAILNFPCSVGYFAIACNVLHYFSDRIQALNVEAEFCSIVNVTDAIAKAHNPCALFSIAKVLEFGRYSPYRNLSLQYGFETPALDAADELVRSIKSLGAHHPQTLQLWNAMVESTHAETIILACTDLPLLPLENYPHKTFFDVTDELAKQLALKSYFARKRIE